MRVRHVCRLRFRKNSEESALLLEPSPLKYDVAFRRFAGGEYSVLKGVNFEELTVDVICVESTVSEGQAEKNDNVKNLLISKGFVR